MENLTIYDIARKAGVSASTVSRVINNRPGIKEATRDKVKALLAEYRYNPNQAARGLVKQSTKLIGILIADIRNIHYTEGAFIIERYFTEKGYNTLIINTGTDVTCYGKYIQMLSARNVNGVVLVGSIFQSPYVMEALQLYMDNIPVVIENGNLDLPNVHGIVIDEYNGVKDAVLLFKKKKKLKIAFVIDCYTPSNKNKLSGYIDGMAILGEKPLVIDAESSEAGYAATKNLLSEHPEVNGIIYSVDLLAAKGLRALQDMGKHIPDDIAIMGIDNSMYCDICYPKLSSLDTQLLYLSNLCSDVLSLAMEEEKPHERLLVPATMKERETT